MSGNKKLTSKIQSYKKLLVEGSDDLNVCYHLLRSHYIDVEQYGIEIVAENGIENLLQDIDVEVSNPKLTNLGLLVDADDDIARRWQSIRAILRDLRYSTAPVRPHPNGTIIYETDRPTVGIWIMPNNELPGMLEHFCRFLVPDDDSLWEHAENIVEQVMQVDCRFPQPHIMKAQIHSWLAWQDEPGKPLGQAITKKFLDAQAPYAQQFISWIRRLYGLNNEEYT